MQAPGRSRGLRGAAVAAAAATLLTACATGAPQLDVAASGQPAGVALADEQMPSAPHDEASWLRAVDGSYSAADAGRGADAWLRQRMAQRRTGERLAIVMGLDDVMVATHFAGIGTLVPRSVRFARTVAALGYAVFYVTGRPYADGVASIEATFERAGVPASGFCARPVGAPDEETGKAECRAALVQEGYTLAMSVAASEASFDGAPRPELEIRLPAFSLSG